MIFSPYPRLGRKPHNPEHLALAPKISATTLAGLPKPPDKLDRNAVNLVPALAYNDVAPDCTAVALLNYLLAFAALNNAPRLPYQRDKVLDFYAECADLPPHPSYDQIIDSDGAVMLDVLKRQHDLGFDCGTGLLYRGEFGTVDPHDLGALRTIVNATGGMNIGVDLALSDQSAEIWDTDLPASAGDPAPGSWGGHDLILFDYDGTDDTDLVTWLTWGKRKKSTVRWLKSRIAEAHGMAWGQCMPASGKTWLGLSYDQLRLAA